MELPVPYTTYACVYGGMEGGRCRWLYAAGCWSYCLAAAFNAHVDLLMFSFHVMFCFLLCMQALQTANAVDRERDQAALVLHNMLRDMAVVVTDAAAVPPARMGLMEAVAHAQVCACMHVCIYPCRHRVE